MTSRILIIRAFANSASRLSQAANPPTTLTKFLQAMQDAIFQNEIQDGKILISTSEAGGAVAFQIPQDQTPIHGHEYKFAISNPVNAARGLFLRAKSYAMCGHFHQSSYHSEKTLEQKIVATWSTGCLCDMHPDYAPINNWSHGFAMVHVSDNGKFEVENRVIRGGKIY